MSFLSPHRAVLPGFALVVLLLLGLLLLPACRDAQCRQMMQCCEAVQDLDEIGGVCADLGSDTRDPQTCRTVLTTISHILDDQDQPLPQACQQG